MAAKKKTTKFQVVSKNRTTMTDKQARTLYPVLEQMGGGASWPHSLKPEEVWEAVKKDKNHPLREWYEWDAQKGWNLYGIERTRWLIQQIAVRGIVHRGKPREFVTRAFIHMPKDETHDSGYRPIADVLREEKNDDIQTRQRLKFLKQWLGASRGVLDAIGTTGRPAPALEVLVEDVSLAIERAEAALVPVSAAAE